MRVAVRGWAASSLEIHSEEDWTDDAPEVEAACLAFRRGLRRCLVFSLNEADAVVDGLTTLSNTEDERAEDRAERRRDPEGTRYARLSSDGLSELSVRVCRAIGTARTT